MPRWPALLAVALAACLHRPPPPLRSARLVVQRVRGSVRPFVRATIDGEPLSLLVDTGAAQSVLPTEFARRHRLGQARRDIDPHMVDAHGHMSRAQLASRVPVQFEGEQPGTLDFLVDPADDIREAILTPQDLVRPGFALVIDLGASRLRYLPEEAALAELAPLAAVDFKGCPAEGLLERNHRVIAVTINGAAAQMLIDTGASRTLLARNNPALQSMLELKGRRITARAMTSEGQTLLVPEVPVQLAGAALAATMAVEPVPLRCAEGLLGADLLSSCTLVWGWSGLWMSCRAS